jgi:hypothetical protein
MTQARHLSRSHPRRVSWLKQLCVACDEDTLHEIDIAAKLVGLTRSEWVRQRLEWALLDQWALDGKRQRGSDPEP